MRVVGVRRAQDGKGLCWKRHTAKAVRLVQAWFKHKSLWEKIISFSKLKLSIICLNQAYCTFYSSIRIIRMFK